MVDVIMSSIGWIVCISSYFFLIISVVYFYKNIAELEGRIEDLEDKEGEENE